MRKLAEGLEDRIVALIREGSTTQQVMAATGAAESTVRSLAVKHRLTLCSRYSRHRGGTYWARRHGHERPRERCGTGRRK